MKYIFRKIWLFAFIVSSIYACERPPSKTKDQVMQERLEKSLTVWKEAYLKKCQTEILKAASNIVDSTLLADARINRDLSGMPNIPGRPNRPGFEAPEDSTPIAPLLKFIRDSLLLDSLGYDFLQIDSILMDSISIDSIYLDSIR